MKRLNLFSLVWCSLVAVLCRLVSGAGDIKLTKDGNVLLHEMVRGGGGFKVLVRYCPFSPSCSKFNIPLLP